MYLSTLENKNRSEQHSTQSNHRILNQGGVVRFDTTKKEIYLVFTGHEFGDGGKCPCRVQAAPPEL